MHALICVFLSKSIENNTRKGNLFATFVGSFSLRVQMHISSIYMCPCQNPLETIQGKGKFVCYSPDVFSGMDPYVQDT